MLTTDELAQVSALVHEILNVKAPTGRNGIVVPGSYDAATSTVDVLLSDTAIVFPDDASSQPMVEQGVPLATTHLDDGHGPFGGEQVHLIPIQSGYIAQLYRTPDPGVDAPGVPQGERWISLRDQHGTILAYVRLTLNAAGSADGLGALRVLAGGLLSIVTNGGFSIVADDTAKTLTLTSPGGLKIIFDDNQSKLLIGTAGLGAPDETVTKTDLQAAITAIEAVFNTHTHAGVQSGSSVTAPPAQQMTVTATGSSVVENEE